MSREPSIKKEKEREILTDGLRILARIIAREYLKNNQKFMMERLPEKKEVSEAKNTKKFQFLTT